MYLWGQVDLEEDMEGTSVQIVEFADIAILFEAVTG